jgi:CPA1 family monovalent cation:H+ antiporter
MGEAEVLIAGLLVAVAGLSAVARQLSVPYPIVLVVGGALFGFVPGVPDVKLDPDVVLVVFLPPLLYGAAIFANFNDLRANLRALTLSTVGLVLATMCAVAGTAHSLIGGLSWEAAFVLGAIVSPTNPLAAAVVMRHLDAPRRMVSAVMTATKIARSPTSRWSSWCWERSARHSSGCGTRENCPTRR